MTSREFRSIAEAQYAIRAEAERLRAERDEAGIRWGEHYNAALAAAQSEAARLRRVVQAVEARHLRLRAAISQVHAWPDGVTGKRMVVAEDLLTILDTDAAELRAALAEGSGPTDDERPRQERCIDAMCDLRWDHPGPHWDATDGERWTNHGDPVSGFVAVDERPATRDENEPCSTCGQPMDSLGCSKLADDDRPRAVAGFHTVSGGCSVAAASPTEPPKGNR